MDGYLKKCESVTTEEKEMQLILSKKRKVYCEFENCNSGAELEENSVSPATSRTSGLFKRDESNDAVEKCLNSPDLEIVELESEGFETENYESTGCVFSREGTPTCEFYGDSEEVLEHISPKSKMKSSTPPPTNVRKKKVNSVAVMPSAAELDEFFATAEKSEQERFAEKYNYDIVKDVPLQGKYQWVRLLP